MKIVKHKTGTKKTRSCFNLTNDGADCFYVFFFQVTEYTWVRTSRERQILSTFLISCRGGSPTRPPTKMPILIFPSSLMAVETK